LLVTRRKDNEDYGFNFKVDFDFFPEIVWPEIAEIIPPLETLKIIREWAGLYSVCTWDSNETLGIYPEINNLYLAIGFSGHGLQQAPSVGKGISELIQNEQYETIDLTPFRFERKQEKDLIKDEGLVGTFMYKKSNS
jgi:glycine/D-amino acid oxidase-like deaminating enzyme